MRQILPIIAILASAFALSSAPEVRTQPSWPMFGGSPARNMVCTTARNLPDDWNVEKKTNIKWVADLGTRTYGQPVIAGDHVLIGTNNGNPRNKRDRARPDDDNPDGVSLDKGILMCFRASDGKFLWQAVHDKLEAVNDWPRVGICSTPAIEGERAYYVSNRGEVVCVDLLGFANGNDSFQKEKYRTSIDADIIWSYDMMNRLKVFPHNKAASSPLIVGDLLYVVTGNGVNETHDSIPSPLAPSFICLNKRTGELVWQSDLPGIRIMHGQWSSPTYAEIKGKGQVIFPGGDGWLYSFEPKTGELIWLFDANPKDSLYEIGGRGSRSDFIGAPVVYLDRIFIGVSQDPEHFDGVGHFWCIDPSDKLGDISPELVTDPSKFPPLTKPNPSSGVVWHYGGEDKRKNARRDIVFGRTLSTACIVDDVIYIPDIAGYVHCLDAKTGKRYWCLDTRASIWSSAYYADGKVFLTNEDGDVFVIRHSAKPTVLEDPDDAYLRARESFLRNFDPKPIDEEVLKNAKATAGAAYREANRAIIAKVVIRKIEMDDAIRGTPAAVGDTLYIASDRRLYAIAKK
jgi:outer membrane protein assembly factor BamB